MTGSSFLSRAWVCSLLAGVGAIVAATPTVAQLIQDTTPGRSLGTQVVPSVDPRIDLILNGTQRGQNLFHSFQEFNVQLGRGAYFEIPNATIQNVLARVTGGNRSEILGTLGTFRASDRAVRVPGVNLFLVNPNGIVFGANASLDVGGSFFATTANAVQLGVSGLFSASQPESSNLLAVDPSAFLFNAIANQNLPEIVVRSQATNTVLGDLTIGLQVPDGQQLLLLGGNVNLDGSLVFALGGRVEIGAITGLGTVGLNTNGSLQVPDSVQRADVVFINAAGVDVFLDRGGDIGITARNITISGDSELTAGILNGFGAVGNQAGDVALNATGAIRIEGQSSRITNDVNSNATGNGGNLTLTAGSLVITDGAQLSTSTLGQGDAGGISIHAQAISIDGGIDNFRSGIFNNVQSSGVGKGGTIDVQTNTLNFTNGGQITAATFGQGDAGSTSIRAQAISIDGGVNTFRSGVLNNVESSGVGKGGTIDVQTNTLNFTNGGQITAATFGQGDAGSTSIRAQAISIDGGVNTFRSGVLNNVESSGVGKGGTIDVQTNTLNFTNGGQITAATFGQGDAGSTSIRAQAISINGGVNTFRSGVLNNVESSGVGKGGTIDVQTNTLNFTNGGQITAATFGQGDAGSTSIRAQAISINGGVNTFRSGVLNNVESSGVGKGGTIDVQTNTLNFTNGGQIASATFGQGDAGRVFIGANNLNIVGISADGNPSGLFSTSSQNAMGNGGNLSIEARNLNLSNGGRLTSQSQGVGNAGNITVNARSIRMRSNSDILTISNSGDGGNITLNARTIVALENSDILAFAPAGKGGNITFNTRAFLSDPLYRPSPSISDRAALFALLTNNQVDVNASGTVSGTVSGVPDVTFLQNSLTQLSDNLIDPNTLLANSCIVRNREQNGSFFVTGSGGLPVRPGDAPPASFPTGEVRSLPTTQSQSDRPWQLGDAIVEPQGIYRLPNGKLVMSRECQNQ